MADRYEGMRALRDDLNKLFELCGLKVEQVEIGSTPALIRLAASLVKDHALLDYLDTLDCQAKKAVKELEAKQIDQWSNEQNELRIEQLEKQITQYQKKLELLLKEKRRVEKENDSPKRTLPIHKVGDPGPQEQGHLEMIRSLISMRDNLLIRRDWLKDNAPDDQNTMKLIESQLYQTANILKKSGVEILEDQGGFDSNRHTVVDTRPTDDPLLVNQIVEVFRPGYTYQGEVLRGEEVILYVKG